MEHRHIAIVMAIVMLLTSCSTVVWQPQKEAMVRVTIANVADGVSTGIAMATQGAAEGNPIGWYVVPVKLGVSYGIIPMIPKEYQVNIAKMSSDITMGAVANNLIVATGITSCIALPIAFGVVVPYLLFCDFSLLPDKLCIKW